MTHFAKIRQKFRRGFNHYQVLERARDVTGEIVASCRSLMRMQGAQLEAAGTYSLNRCSRWT